MSNAHCFIHVNWLGIPICISIYIYICSSRPIFTMCFVWMAEGNFRDFSGIIKQKTITQHLLTKHIYRYSIYLLLFFPAYWSGPISYGDDVLEFPLADCFGCGRNLPKMARVIHNQKRISDESDILVWCVMCVCVDWRTNECVWCCCCWFWP